MWLIFFFLKITLYLARKYMWYYMLCFCMLYAGTLVVKWLADHYLKIRQAWDFYMVRNSQIFFFLKISPSFDSRWLRYPGRCRWFWGKTELIRVMQIFNCRHLNSCSIYKNFEMSCVFQFVQLTCPVSSLLVLKMSLERNELAEPIQFLNHKSLSTLNDKLMKQELWTSNEHVRQGTIKFFSLFKKKKKNKTLMNYS